MYLIDLRERAIITGSIGSLKLLQCPGKTLKVAVAVICNPLKNGIISSFGGTDV